MKIKLAFFIILAIAVSIPFVPVHADIQVITTGQQSTTSVTGIDGTGINMSQLSGQQTCIITARDTGSATYAVQGSADGIDYITPAGVPTVNVGNEFVQTVFSTAGYSSGFQIQWSANTGTLQYTISCSPANSAASTTTNNAIIPQPLGAVVNPKCTVTTSAPSCTMPNLGPSSGCSVWITGNLVGGVATFSLLSPAGNSQFVEATSFDGLIQGTNVPVASESYQVPCSGAGSLVVNFPQITSGTAIVEIIATPYGSVTALQGNSACNAQNPLPTVINVGASTTLQLIAAIANAPINVCGGNFTLAGTQPTATFEYGTNLNCSTNPTVLSGAFTVIGSVIIPAFQVPLGKALCLVTTVTTSAQGMITAVQPGAIGPATTPAPTSTPTTAPTAPPTPPPSGPSVAQTFVASPAGGLCAASMANTLGAQPSSGQLIIIVVGHNVQSDTMTPPAGFSTELSAQGSSSWAKWVFYKFSTGSDGPSYPITSNCGSGSVSIKTWVVAGANTSTPFDNTPSVNASVLTGTTGPFCTTALTVNVVGDLPIASIGTGSASQVVSSFTPTTMTNAPGEDANAVFSENGFYDNTQTSGSYSACMTMTTTNSFAHQTQIQMLIEPAGSETTIWQQGNASLGKFVTANTFQCGNPSVTTTQSTFVLSQGAASGGGFCGRNQENPVDSGGVNLIKMNLNQQYTFTFQYIDGTPTNGAPGMGYDKDARSLIWQNINTGDCGIGINLNNGGTIGAAEQWWFEDTCTAAGASPNGLWTHAWTAQQTVNWKIVIFYSTTTTGYVHITFNGTETDINNIVTAATGWSGSWNFGIYKWIWENSPNDSTMTTVNATFNNMLLQTP